MRQNKFDEADQLLRKLRTMDPDAFSVIIAQVHSDILQSRADEAIKLCDETVARLNNLDAYILRSKTFATLNQPDKALKDLDHVVAVEPDNVNGWVARSDFYRSVGQPDKAFADINRALSLASDNLKVQKRAISLFLTSGNSDGVQEGKALLGKALETNPDDVELQITKARLLIAEGTAPAIANAAEILQKITENQPRIDEAWVLLGNLLLRQGQSSKAMDTVLRGLANNPANKPLLLLKASVEAGQSPSLAIPTLKGLRDMDPNDLEVAVNLANAYVEAKEPEKAVTLLRKQLNMCGDDASRQRCNAALAVALFKDGKKEEAEKILTTLSESNPDDNRVLFVQISLLKEKGQYADIVSKARDWFERNPQDVRTPVAVADGLIAEGGGNKDAVESAENILRMVITRMPDNTMAIQSLANVLQIAGRNSEAAKLNQQLIEIAPNNVVAMNNLAWVLCEEQGKYQQAIELADKGLKIAPRYVDLMDTRGVAYYRLGKYDKAIEDFTASLKLYPVGASGRISSYFHLARAFAAVGEKSKAVEYLNETLNIQNQSGGLSPKDLDEAQRLLKGLSKEN
jgi:tetratricopeptide (TPR) repeat protein